MVSIPPIQDIRLVASLASPTTLLILLVLAFLVLRVGLAAEIPLSIDEAYAIVVSRSHSLSYFDHPPIGFALARFVADLTGCECRLFVRLPYVVLGSLSALLLFDLTRYAYGVAAALWATAWYTVAPFFFISAGHFVVPDGPLDFFLLASAWAVAPMLLGGTRRFALLRWIVAGVALGLALLSKYQATLFCVSALLVLLTTKSGRSELRTLGPWVAASLAVLALVPVLVWNMDHGWASFGFQFARGMVTNGHILHPENLALTLLGQVGYVWPPVWLVATGCIWRGVRGRSSATDRFFGLISVVPVVFFDLIALFSAHSLPHWSMSGFLFAFPLVGQWCSRFSERKPGVLKASFACAAIVVPLLATGFALQAKTAVFTRLFYDRAPNFDVNWQIIDWTALTDKDGNALKDANAYVVASNWMQAARIALALGPDVPIEVLPADPRHFQYLADKRLNARGNGFFVGALRFDDEAVHEKAYRDSLDGPFVVNGPPRHITQSIAGFPVFDILILPIKRSEPLQSLPQGSVMSHGGAQ